MPLVLPLPLPLALPPRPRPQTLWRPILPARVFRCEEYGAAHPGGKEGLRRTLREVTGKTHGFLQIDVSRSPPRFLDGFKPLPLPPPS